MEIRGLLTGLILGTLTSVLIFNFINTNYVPHINRVIRYSEESLPGKVCGAEWEKVRLAVFVMTTPKNWPTKGIAVQRTWAKRFDHYKFLYSSSNTKINIPSSIAVDITEGREHLTAKAFTGFTYLYKHYLNSSDWFMKADDDTYVIVENLKLYLSKLNASEPSLVGHRFWHELPKSGHMSGGAGYVISRAALVLLIEKGLKDSKLCPNKDGGYEDVFLASCLHALGAKFYDAIDLVGNNRFHPFDPLTLLNGRPTTQGNFRYRNIFGLPQYQGAMSTESISFHYVSPGCMYMYDFLLYGMTNCLKPGSISKSKAKVTQTQNDTKTKAPKQ